MSFTLPEFKNLTEMIRHWAKIQPEKLAFNFLEDGEEQENRWTYATLDERARCLAAQLQVAGLQGERAVLIYPPGLDYIAGFLGCAYAGVIAVPAYPPDPNRLDRTLPRLQSIVQDSESKVILTTEMIKGMAGFIGTLAPDLTKLKWIASDSLDPKLADQWKDPNLNEDDLVFLQYTSGSTGDPKGVMLSYKNVLYNLNKIKHAFSLERGKEFGVSWLPPYHDMGLIGGILEPLYGGHSSVLISPLHFLQRPLRWLEAISKYKATISGGPNFAFEMCARRVTPEQKAKLDLSSWGLAFSGAEPVIPATLDRFTQAFSECGFRPEILYPCYGLAEATLMVSASTRGKGVISRKIDREEFKKNAIVDQGLDKPEAAWHLVGCGETLPDQRVLIARPDTLHPCEDGEVGEILVQGPSVAPGYWNKPELNRSVFAVSLPNRGGGSFLRTGDLGFLDQGELYVTGRLKDLIIIRGQNHYPQDIERTVEGCYQAIRAGCSAAFSVREGYEEHLVLVVELDPDKFALGESDIEKIGQEVRQAVGSGHDLELAHLVWIKKGSLPKTSSGKVRRRSTCQEFMEGTLSVLQSADFISNVQGEGRVLSLITPAQNPEREEIQGWISERLASLLGVDVLDVDPTQPLSELGLDSKQAVSLSGELEEWLEQKISPTLLWKYPTIEKISGYLGNEAN